MVSPVTYIRQTWDEMQKVVWPSRDEVIRLTLTVIAISVIVGFYIGAIDYILTFIVEQLLR